MTCSHSPFLSSSFLHHPIIMHVWPFLFNVTTLTDFTFFSDPPPGTGVQGWGLKPKALPVGAKTTSVHDTCSPKTQLFASFHSSSPFISLLLFQSALSFFPFGLPPISSEQVIPPEGQFKPFTYSQCRFLQLSQQRVSVVNHNQRHLSQDPAAQTVIEASKKGPNLVKDWKQAKGRLQKKIS